MKSKQLRLLLSRSGSRSLFIVIAISSAISTTLIICLAVVVSRIVVGLVQGDDDVMREIVLLAALWLFRAFFQSQYEFWCTARAIKIKQDLRSEVTNSLAEISATSPSALSNLLIKGFNSLDIYLGRFLPQMVVAMITPLAVIIAIGVLDPTSAVIAILTLPLIPFFGALIGRYTSDSVSKKWATLGTLSKYFEDSLRGFITLRIFGRHKSQGTRIQEMGDRYTSETMKVLRISFLSALALELCATISVALIAVAIGLRLVDGEITFLAGLTVLLLAPEVYFPLRNAATLFHASADGTAALGEIADLRKTQRPQVSQQTYDFSKMNKLLSRQWKLELPGIAQSSLSEFSLSKGEIIFLTGESGIGKTTFAQNLLGEDFSSNLEVDGTLILDATFRNAWREVIGWIPQSPQLMMGTIAQQFHQISPNITDVEISTYLRELGLDLIELPDGLQTQIGGSGEKSDALSGGQLRKIAIARALMCKPVLIIADEPTADLDQASADRVMNALRKATLNGAMLVCITHDTAVMNPSDRRLAFERAEL
jgi:ABC-type transport system involved in cytochrome bd biosynthesis fused ATPase/permease subunit